MKEILKEACIIKSINGKRVDIALNYSDGCKECSANIFCNPSFGNEKVLSVSSNKEFNIGESVEVNVQGRTVFLFTVFLYGLPLVIVIASILLGIYFLGDTNNSEIFSFAIGVALLVIYYLIFNYIIKHNSELFNYPTIIKTDN